MSEHVAGSPTGQQNPEKKQQLITRRRLIGGGLAVAAAAGVSARLVLDQLGGYTGSIYNGAKVQLPDTASESSAPHTLPPSSSSHASSSASTEASPGATTPNHPLGESGEPGLQPGTRIGLFLGMAFRRAAGNAGWQGIYNPVIEGNNVYSAQRTNSGLLVLQQSGGAIDSWLPANTTRVVTGVVGFDNIVPRGFDGYVTVSGLGPLPTYSRSLAGQSAAGPADMATLKRLGIIGHLTPIANKTNTELAMVAAGATVPYPAD